MAKPDYDTSIARMAGNIACGLSIGFNLHHAEHRQQCAEIAVQLSRAIVAEIRRTESDANKADV